MTEIFVMRVVGFSCGVKMVHELIKLCLELVTSNVIKLLQVGLMEFICAGSEAPRVIN